MEYDRISKFNWWLPFDINSIINITLVGQRDLCNQQCFPVKLPHSVVLILALSSLNAMQASVALTGKCGEQLTFVWTGGGARSQLRREYFYCLDRESLPSKIVDCAEMCKITLVLLGLHSLIFFELPKASAPCFKNINVYIFC